MTQELQAVLPSEAQMRAAIADRNSDYDPVFLYGVVTTGVFCLPSCPARPARPENLRFFSDPQQALSAGLRPCKRCRPTSVPVERDRLVELARYIEANATSRLTLKALAERVQMSPNRMQKRFRDCFGVTPREYQDGIRLKQFKSSLSDGKGVTDAIFEAGYGSTSRIYGASTRSIGMTPKSYRAGAPGESIHYAQRNTALGWLMMAATLRGVCFVQFGDDPESLLEQLGREFPKASIERSSSEDSPDLDQWMMCLQQHLAGNSPLPDLPLDLRGTAFQIKVWRFLLSVPEGEVISYGELAEGIEKPTAVRAAASACGANRIALLIPCHRVLRGDGSLGGYRWGIERKRTLISAERSRHASQ